MFFPRVSTNGTNLDELNIPFSEHTQEKGFVSLLSKKPRRFFQPLRHFPGLLTTWAKDIKPGAMRRLWSFETFRVSGRHTTFFICTEESRRFSGMGILRLDHFDSLLRHPREEELLTAAPHLPNALVFLPPVVAHPVDQPDNVHPFVVPDRRAVLVIQVHRVHELAEDVELEMVLRGVADADRTRPHVAFQVGHGGSDFGKFCRATN